ncbi:response regulator [Sphingomonas sp. MMS12-HWE2-04]|uniref:response regulator n=1 Tax=Sphingomonas sp. MMS12-HWE2-04 TaxID=3234199 RepID=UPI003850969A
MARRILVIDDDEAIRFSVAILLRAKGYIVTLGVDGADGFDQFIKHQPEIVISDMVMPGNQSIQTIAKMRALNPKVAIIAMSGSIQGGPESFLKRAQEAGANHYLEKPFEAQQLLSLLKQVEDDGELGAAKNKS